MTDTPLGCFFIELADGSPCSLALVVGCPKKKRRRYQNNINPSFGTEEISSSESSTFIKVSPGATIVATTGIIEGGAMLIIIAILIIKCVRKTKLQSVSAKEQSTNDTAACSHSSPCERI